MHGARSRYPVPGRRINEGPGTFLEEPRAFYTLARMKARSPCLYAIAARLCPVLRAGMMGASEQTYRLYSCRRCAEQVRICSDCDRGNRYCAGACAQIRRRESLHRAGERYQLSYRGASLHAARQSTWRSRQAQKVTHQGSLPSADTVIVAAISTQTTTAGTHVDMASMQAPPPPHSMPQAALSAAPTRAHGRWHGQRMARTAERCSFCWRALPPFARLGTLRGGP
jgi:hypothetical protein